MGNDHEQKILKFFRKWCGITAEKLGMYLELLFIYFSSVLSWVWGGRAMAHINYPIFTLFFMSTFHFYLILHIICTNYFYVQLSSLLLTLTQTHTTTTPVSERTPAPPAPLLSASICLLCLLDFLISSMFYKSAKKHTMPVGFYHPPRVCDLDSR